MRGATNPAMAMMTALLCTACGPGDQDMSDQLETGAEQAADQVQQAAQGFTDRARGALDDLDEQLSELDSEYSDLQGDAAAGWDQARQEIEQTRDALSDDLSRLADASGTEAEELRGRIAGEIETLTRTTETAELRAKQAPEEFVAASRDQLREIDQDIEALRAEAVSTLDTPQRQEVMTEIDGMRQQADEIAQRVSSMADATPDAIAEARDELTEVIASLSASVRRQAFEISEDPSA